MEWRSWWYRWRSSSWRMRRRLWSPCRRSHRKNPRRSARLRRWRWNISLLNKRWIVWGFLIADFFFLYQKANVKMTLCFCLQEALAKAKAEALRWQMLYKELKLSSGQLRENQLLSDEQLQQLHSQVEVQCSLWTCWMVSSFNENVCNVCVL